MSDGACMTVAEAIRGAAQRLAATSGTARLDAELLMAHALGVVRSDLLIRHMGTPAPAGFAALVDRRAAYEPVAYITGQQEFFGRGFGVTPDVLIPRGDSEVLIEAALSVALRPRRIVDLGTGSGALLISSLCEYPQAQGYGIDASAGALEVARANALALGLGEDRAGFLMRDWHAPGWADDLGTFDLVLCNPPYVEDDAKLDPDVRAHEPARALFAGKDGLDDYRALIPQLRQLMSRDAAAILEIGHTQARAVSEIARSCGFTAELRKDLANRPRCVILR